MNPRTIVAVLDSSAEKDVALTAGLSIARWYGSDLHVLDVRPSGRLQDGDGAAIRDHLVERITVAARASGAGAVRITPSVLAGDVHDGILAAASGGRTDVIVLGLPRRPRLEQLVAGSTVHRVIRRATAPVLLVPGRSTTSLYKPWHDYDGRFAGYRPQLEWRAGDTVGARGGGASWR